ncbi:MAG: hypothetical protein Q9162_002232 [Coniocarpon cinnabarinum]
MSSPPDAPLDPFPPVRPRRIPQPVPHSHSTNPPPNPGALRSASTPTTSGLPRVVPGQKKSVRDLAAGFEGRHKDTAAHVPTPPLPALATRSTSATSSGLPRPKTPSSRAPEATKLHHDPQALPRKPTSPHSNLTSSSEPRNNLTQQHSGTRDAPATSKSSQARAPPPLQAQSFSSVTSERKLYGEITADEGGESLGHGIPHQVKRSGSDGSLRHMPVSPTEPNANLHHVEAHSAASASDSIASHRRSKSDASQSDATTVAAAMQPLDFAALPTILQPEVMQDIMDKRQQSRIPASTHGARKRSFDDDSKPMGASQRYGNGEHHRSPTPPSPLSFSPLETFPKSPEKRLNASIREASPKKSPALRSSRPRQRVSAVNGTSNKGSFSSPSPERRIPGAFRDSFVDKPQDSPVIPEIRTESRSGSFSNHAPSTTAEYVQPNLLTQLSSAVYQKQERPKLAVQPNDARHERAHTPGSVTEFEETATDFEEDTPLSATRPDFPPSDEGQQNSESVQQEVEQFEAGNQDGSSKSHRDSVQRQALGLTVKTDHIERRPPPQFVPHRPLEASPALSQDADNAGTIDIVLDDALLQFAPQASSTKSPESGQSNHAQSQISSPEVNEHGYLVPKRVSDTYEGRINVDDDGYTTYNNIIDEYQQSGSLSPDMIQQFQQHILVSGNAIPMHQFEQHVQHEALSRQTSQYSLGFQPSPLRIERTREQSSLSSQSTRDSATSSKMYPTAGPIEAPAELPAELTAPQKSAPPSTNIGSEDDTASNATPLPHRISAQTVHSTTSEQPSLPEIQDTGGGLGLLHPENAPAQTRLGVERIGTLSRSTDSSLASQQQYARSIDSQQATSGQQEGPETPPTSLSRPQSFRSTEQSSRQPSVDQNGFTIPEAPILSQRQRVIQELIDTEYAYYQDMTVLHDIYLETTGSCADLTTRDIALLFGNTAEMVKLSREYADRLKDVTRGVYVRSRKLSGRASEMNRDSSISTSSSNRLDPAREMNVDEADHRTAIGMVTLEFLPRMEKIYAEYLKNAESANQTLKRLKDMESVKSWLAECYEHAKDLTEAWNLDALIIKPTQRITRYPLLLTELRRHTADDHPDRKKIEAARDGLVAINQRINQLKKQSDLIKNATSHEPKRTNFFKPILNWTDKTRQKMGKADFFEDLEYNSAFSLFSSGFMKLSVVLCEFQNQLTSNDGIRKACDDFTEAWRGFLDIKPSAHPELESKWRRYVAIIKELFSRGYEDHVSQVHRSCIHPLRALLEVYKGVEGTTKKRKERLNDYIRYRSLKEKGDKVDKKLTEAAEEFEALNEVLKIELPKLRSKTKSLVSACLSSFAVLTGRWYEFWQRQIMPIVEDDKWRQPFAEYVRHHDGDWAHWKKLVDDLTARNRHLWMGTADFIQVEWNPQWDSRTDSEDWTLLTPPPARQISEQTTLSSAHRGSTSSVSPSMNMSTRASNDSGRSYSSSAPHSRNRSRSHNQQRLSKPAPPLPPVPPQIAAPSVPHNSSFFLNQTPPASNQEPSSYLAANNLSSRYQLQDRQDRRASDSKNATSLAVRPSANQFAQSTQSPPSALSRGIYQSALPMPDSPTESTALVKRSHYDRHENEPEYEVFFVAASLYEFNINPSREEQGFPYLTYQQGAVFDVIGCKGELWMARNQDDKQGRLGWIWERHFKVVGGECR